MKIIRIINASFKFDNQPKYLIENLSFDIFKSDRVYIQGENGTGKTTLMKLLIGVLDFNNGDIEYLVPQQKLFVPTKLDDFLLSWYSVKQNFNFFKFKGKNINTDEYNTKYIDFIKNFFPERSEFFLNKKIYELSSGEKAVVSFICSQLSSSNIFFFDELFANTSLNISKKIINYIIKNSLTVIFTSHSKKIADLLCTRTIKI